jgi:hypothetical protein
MNTGANLSSGQKVFDTNNLFGTPGRNGKGKGKNTDDDNDLFST